MATQILNPSAINGSDALMPVESRLGGHRSAPVRTEKNREFFAFLKRQQYLIAALDSPAWRGELSIPLRGFISHMTALIKHCEHESHHTPRNQDSHHRTSSKPRQDSPFHRQRYPTPPPSSAPQMPAHGAPKVDHAQRRD